VVNLDSSMITNLEIR